MNTQEAIIIYSNIKHLPIENLIMRKDEIAAAVSNLSRGLPSMTEGPLQVSYHEAIDRFELVNVYHRLVEALMRGEDTVPVQSKGPAEWEPPPTKNVFAPDWDEEYQGMESFIELYELRRMG